MSTQPRIMSRRWMVTYWYGLLAALLIVSVAVAPGVARSASPLTRTAVTTPATYTNPVIPRTAPDPAIIKALDGYYYIVATSDTWQDGSFHLLPTWRSTDLVNWSFVGDAVPSRAAWVAPTAGLYAPDLQYFDHKYYMYYAAADTVAGGSAIGLYTAPSMTGPWTDAGGPIVGPRTCSFSADPTCHPATIDPAEFTDQDGQKYLYYGSFFGGTLVQRLTPDGLSVTGPAYEIGHWDRYEGTYVVRHDVNGKAYYYNFSSAADCCRGPNTGYSVEVSRATSPLGPFYDQNSYPMQQPGPDGTEPQAPTARPAIDDPGLANIGAQGGGYPTLKQNGNKWQGVGHNALITDLSGRDWIVYHGVDKTSNGGVSNGWVNSFPGPTPPQITYRQLLIDRIDWTSDGWPTTNGGAGPSDGPMAAPSTTPIFGDNFNTASGCAAPGSGASLDANWYARGSWSLGGDAGAACVNGGYAVQGATSELAVLVSHTPVPSGYRAECDVRLETAGANPRYGCLVSYRGGRFIAAYLDPTRNALVTQAYIGYHPFLHEMVTPLPARFVHTDWHHLAIDQQISQLGRGPLGHGVTLRVVVSDRDRDPLAVQTRTFPLGLLFRDGGVGLVTRDARADFDNVTAAALATTTVPAEMTPPVGALQPAYSDEFNGSLGAQWSFVRPVVTETSLISSTGQLEITGDGDLYRDSNSAHNLLLESAPSGDYALETKITFDPNANYEQAGLLVYSDDDHYIKVGPFHSNSLNKMLSGYESLEPAPGGQAQCDVQPSATSSVAVATYTRDLCPNEGESWDYLTNAQPTPNGSSVQAPTVTDYLRVYRHGAVYQPYTSVDGVNWVKGAAWSLSAVDAAHPVKIGLFAFSGGAARAPAFFDYVHVYSLPAAG
jgi:arabinan endo-1,5-alpha-L-arabinosidase